MRILVENDDSHVNGYLTQGAQILIDPQLFAKREVYMIEGFSKLKWGSQTPELQNSSLLTDIFRTIDQMKINLSF